MARVYSRRKGQAGSTKPVKKALPSWVRYTPAEVEILIAKLAKEGQSSSEIGVHLRDTYGIPDVKLITKKSISKILKDKSLARSLPEDLLSLIKKTVQLNKHMEKNNHDMTAKRGWIINDSKIRRLIKYYKETGKIASDWKYDSTKARMYLE